MIKGKNIFATGFLGIITIVFFASCTVAASNGNQSYLPIIEKPIPPTVEPPHITGNVVITTIYYDGSGPNEPDEYVEIRNDDSFSILLANWTLRDEANQVFTFPSFYLQPGMVCRIYTNENHPEWCGFNFVSNTAIWNHTGDCGHLMDAWDKPIYDFCY